MELLFQFLWACAQVGLLSCLTGLLGIAFSLQLTYGAILGLGLSLYIAYQRVVYPFIDPLRKFPLVDIADIRVLLPVTDVPRGVSSLRWAKQYPNDDAVRVRVMQSTTALVPLSVDALRDLFGPNQACFEKPSGARSFLANLLGYGLVLSEGAVHKRQRQTLTKSFRVQNIRALHDLMCLKTDILIKNMEQQSAKGSVDITVWASKVGTITLVKRIANGGQVTLDIIGTALMSQEFDSLNIEKQPVNEAFQRLTAASPGMTYLFIMSMIMPQWIVRSLPVRSNSMLVHDVKLIRRNCETTLNALEEETGSSDILASIIQDPHASRSEVVDQMITFLGAGHETTATSIAWITHLLTLPENLHYQDTLQKEVRSAELTSTNLESLPWLNATCEETLRLFPPVTSTARMAVKPTTIAGAVVPKGTLVVVFPWAVNRDPRHWVDSEKFVPERWIDKREDGTLHANNHGGAVSNYCNMTFLQGNRSCIAKGFAKAELRVVIAKLFGAFNVRRLPGDNGTVNPVGSLTIKPEGGLFVSLERVS